MQIHLVKFQAFSQQNYSTKEAELPSFDEAFDTDSLKKFFQEHDSHLSTPFTTYSETPMYEDLQPSLAETKSIFGSPINKYINMPTLSLSSDMEDCFNTKIFNALDKKSYGLDEREIGIIKNRDGSQFDFLEERQETKIKEIVNESNRIRINLNGRSSSLLLFHNLKEELNPSESQDKNLKLLDQDEQQTHIQDIIETRIDLDSKIRNKKKDVFIIVRNSPKVISKKEKEEKKPATLVKKKKSVQLEKKEEEKSSLKKTKKEKNDKTDKSEKEEKIEKADKTEKNEKGEKKSKKKSQSKNLVDIILQKKAKTSKEESK